MSIPITHYKTGALWAWLKGRPIATLASDVFQARTEASENKTWIEENISQRAEDLGISPQELKHQIWKEAGLTGDSVEFED